MSEEKSFIKQFWDENPDKLDEMNKKRLKTRGNDLSWRTLVQRTHYAVVRDMEKIGLKRMVSRNLVFYIINAFLDHSLLGAMEGKTVIWRSFGTFRMKRRKAVGMWNPGAGRPKNCDELKADFNSFVFKSSRSTVRNIMNKQKDFDEYLEYCKKKYGNSHTYRLYEKSKYQSRICNTVTPQCPGWVKDDDIDMVKSPQIP